MVAGLPKGKGARSSRIEGRAYVFGVVDVVPPRRPWSQFRVAAVHSATTISSLRSHPAGLTLVELMMVISIIILLAVLAIPNVARARQNAEDVRTQADLKQIYTAMVTFEAQNNRQATTLAELQPYVTFDLSKYEMNSN